MKKNIFRGGILLTIFSLLTQLVVSSDRDKEKSAATIGYISPENQQIFQGSVASSISLVGPDVVGYNYRWMVSNNGTDFYFATGTGVTTGTYSPGAITQTTYYQVQMTSNTGGQSGFSPIATVIVRAHLAAGTVAPASQSINYNKLPAGLTSTAPTGGIGTYSYQWQQSADNSTFTDISGANQLTYAPGPRTTTTYYRLKTVCGSETVYSSNVVISVIPQINPGSITPLTTTINFATAAGAFAGTTASGGIGSYVYQWQISSDGNSWMNLNEGAGLNYTPDTLYRTAYFRRAVTSGNDISYTNTIVVNVYDQLKSGAVSPDSIISIPENRPGIFVSTAPLGGNGTYTFQWQTSTDTNTWTDVPGANGDSYSPPAITDKPYFRLITASNGVIAASNTVKIKLPIFGGIISTSAAVVGSGGSATLVSLQPASGTGCSSYAYEWQASSDELSWMTISGTAISSLTKTMFYRRKVICGDNIGYSNTVRIKVRNVSAQLIPDGTSVPVSGDANIITIPAYDATLSADNLNYVRTREFGKSGITDLVNAATQTDPAVVQQATMYLDGLGRPLQTVIQKATPAQHDMVTLNFYDQYGRESQNYLPYSDNAADGKFRTNAATQQPAFYDAIFNNRESYYYNNTVYEASPLNRVQKTTKAGHSWTGKNIGVRVLERANSLSDSVVIWNMNSSLPQFGGYYGNGTLYVTETADEHDNKTVEYKTMEGQTILKKVQGSDAAGVGYDGWLCTYYIYDQLDNLRFVISPKGVVAVRNNWSISQEIADRLCFQYQYDSRNRNTVKKIPGAGAYYIVYDIRDRIAFTQDAVQRTKSPQEWLVSFYDEQNRPVETAIYRANTTPEALQTSMNTVSTGSQDISYALPAKADLYINSHDGRTVYTAINSVTLQDGFESTGNAEFIVEINSSATEGNATVRATNPLPGINTSQLEPLTYSYYDNYDFTGRALFVSGEIGKPQAGDNPNAETLPNSPSAMTKGLSTGARVRILGTNEWMASTIYYDAKGRTIQTISENSKGGQDIVTNLYNFKGQLLSSYVNHHNPASATSGLTVLTMNKLDFSGRLLSVRKRLNDDVNQEKTISIQEYDELGQQKQKRIGVTASSQLDIIKYNYNIQGWLQGINKDFVNTASTDNWFGEELNYDYGFGNKLYNGNISGVKWKSGSNGISRAYGYDYDASNRLTKGDFSQQNTFGGPWTADKADFSVSNLTYDANGNIGSMKQKGLVGTAISTIDSLIYTYAASSNQLLSVNDTANTTSAKLGDFIDGSKTGNDYSYDGNGNMITDQNKKISSISYNFLNLPETITIDGKGVIKYRYDATGAKLRKTVIDNTGSSTKTTVSDYIGAFLYQQDTLQYLSHEEGRIRPVYDSGKSVTYTYDYFEKDHLGNVRIVLGTQTDTSVYAATMETNKTATENALFSNIDNTRTPLPSGYPADPTTNPNAQVAKLNAVNGQKIGPSLVLRVMAGDTIQLGVKAFYKSTAANTSSSTTNSMLAALAQAFSGSGISDGVHAGGSANAAIQSSFNPAEYDQLKAKDPAQNLSNKPKAYLNFVLFDDMFNMVDDNSGVKQVQGSPDQLQTLAVDKAVVKKTGFMYIYTSNESGEDVYFDNLVVVHNNGPLLEETHYYPFGLSMAGISSEALKGENYFENKFKYNGKELQSGEFETGSGLDFYDYGSRSLDYQLGRFMQMDPKADKFIGYSPYCYTNNNPILFNDPTGEEIWIYYGDDQRQMVKYENGKLFKADGSAYKEDNKFVSNVFNSLNRLNALEIGKVLLEKLQTTNDQYRIKDNPSIDSKGQKMDRVLSLEPKLNGGEIHASMLMNQDMAESQKIGSLAHELFHAYQNSSNEKGATVNVEVGAYLFDRAVSISLGFGVMGFGKDSKDGKLYDDAMSNMLYGDGTWNQKSYNQAVDNFKSGASVNSNGIYNKFGKKDNDTDPVIKKFFPLIR